MAERGAVALVAGESDRTPTPEERSLLSHGTVLLALARRSLPHVLEATLVPAIISYVLLLTVGAGAAMIAVLGWTYFAVGRRLARGVAIPSILMLATIGLTVRTAIGIASGSTFAYFAQPIATTVVLAAVFAGSVVVGRPGRRPRRVGLLPSRARGRGPARDRPAVPGAHPVVGGGAHHHGGDDVRHARQHVAGQLRRVEDRHLSGHHGRRDRPDRVVLDPHRAIREPRPRTPTSDPTLWSDLPLRAAA